jgi:NAD(P)-dependent dehydrogenase (short-subunit alcohol dehydrogenase family)
MKVSRRDSVTNQVVLITGANGGLGSSVTEAFLNAGAIVAGASRKISPDEFKNPNFHAFPAEISSLAAAKALADSVAQKLGKIDVVIHLIGAFAGGAPVVETDDATWAKMLDLNLNAAFHTLRAVLPHMRKAGRGRIVAIGSRLAVEPQPGAGAYEVSKAALVSLIRAAALENKDVGINVNIVLPDTMDTAVNRAAMPKADFSKWVPTGDVAELLLALAGPAGAAVTGAVIPIYGRNA